MRYLRMIDGVVKYPYTPTDLILSEPNTSFPREISADTLAAFGMVEVVETPRPYYNDMTETVEESVELVGSVWQQKWTVRPLTADEYTSRIPQVVSMRQARRALLDAGLLTMIDAAIAAMTGIEGDKARIDWEYATEISRNSPLVAGMASQLGLTAADLDTLFVAASQVPA